MMMLLPLAALLAMPAELHPAGPWQVSEQELGCQVTRSFAGDGDVEFGFETYLTGSGTTMLIAAPKALLPATGPGEIRVAVSPTLTIDLHYGAFDVADPNTRLLKLFPDKAALDAIASAETVEIGVTPIRVPVKGVRGALKALNTCTEGLLTKWGVDPKSWRDGKLARVAGSPQNWLLADDAQKILPVGVSEASLVLLVTTTPGGTTDTCKAVAGSSHRLEGSVCVLTKRRARFRAPLGDDGKPMASYVVLPIRLSR